MVIFESESALVAALDAHDALVRLCASGELTFEEFCERYNDFYDYYALDGHESDDEETALLEKYDLRIEPHRVIAYDIRGRLCADADANLPSYIESGRFGSKEAFARIKLVHIPA